MKLLLPLLLLAACQAPTAAEHAQAVARQILPTCVVGLQPGSLHTYQLSGPELARYCHPGEAEDGYLVTYLCLVETPKPHLDTFAVFINGADQVREFVPGNNLGLFAQRYGVDYRMQ